jgi:hypothetical protein
MMIFIIVQEKIDILNDRLERECYGSGERSLPPGDLADYPEAKNLSKQKCKILDCTTNILILRSYTFIY